MTRSKRRARVDAFTKELSIGTPEGSREVWGAPVPDRFPLFVAKRARWILIRMADELIIVAPRRRKPFARDDIVARLPYDRTTIRRARWVGPLRQVVVDGASTVGEVEPREYVLEFSLRDRRFAKGVVAAVESTAVDGH